MMDEINLYKKISYLPPELREEVDNFIEFLLSKNRKISKKKPKFGSAKGKIKTSPDFDSPLDDFKEYME